MNKKWFGLLLIGVLSLVGWQFCLGAVSTSSILIAAGGQGDGSSAPLLVQSTDRGQSWQTATMPTEFTKGRLFSASCNTDGSLCIAAGSSGSSTPIAQTTDGGKSWQIISLKGSSVDDMYNSTSCYGNGANAICIAVGQSHDGHPLIAQSIDNGQTWTRETFNPSNSLYSASCSGTHCVAVSMPEQPPFMVQTVDGGKSWNPVKINNMPNMTADSGFLSVNCTQSGKVCVASGYYTDSVSGYAGPLLVQSTDGGNTWDYVQLPDAKALSGETLISTACFVGSDAVHCIATGISGGRLVETEDGGANWSVVNIPIKLPDETMLTPIRCTGSGADAHCLIGGTRMDGNDFAIPYILESSDGGQTWAVEEITGAPTGAAFSAISCTGPGNTDQCIATGFVDINPSDDNHRAPLIAQSLDGGITWNTVQSEALVGKTGYFIGAASSDGAGA